MLKQCSDACSCYTTAAVACGGCEFKTAAESTVDTAARVFARSALKQRQPTGLPTAWGQRQVDILQALLLNWHIVQDVITASVNDLPALLPCPMAAVRRRLRCLIPAPTAPNRRPEGRVIPSSQASDPQELLLDSQSPLGASIASW